MSVGVGGQTTSFLYDGDGNLVKKTKTNGNYVLYIGSVYEVEKNSGGTVLHTTVYYPAGGAVRVDNTLYYVLGDQLGSASAVLDNAGNKTAETRYYPFGETRVSTGSMPTDRLFTGQRAMDDLGIYFYNARFYSSSLGRFLSADTELPGAANSQAYDRYAYNFGNPIIFVDPSGHGPGQPPPPGTYPLIQDAINYFRSAAGGFWQIVGDPEAGKDIFTNGADLAFTRLNEVLAVELKDVQRSVNLGTLGKNIMHGDYGGSIDQVVRSANRFFDSTNKQLREESQTIVNAFNNGNLKNALFTSANRVSNAAQNQFNGVYTKMKDGTVNTLKALPSLAQSFFTQLGNFAGNVEIFPMFTIFDSRLLDPSRFYPQQVID